jgi:hydrogenase maturation protease
MQIIGCGNRQRGDDASGVLVAERLRKMGIPAEVHSGGAFELVASWNPEEPVILIDAVVTGSAPGTVHVWQGHPPRVECKTQISSHGFGLAEAINLAQILGQLPRLMRVYGIEAREFRIGQKISPEVLAAVEQVVCQIASYFERQMAIAPHHVQISGAQ